MNEGNFIRILYSNHLATLNGIYLFFSFQGISCEKYYNKYKCVFTIENHKERVQKIQKIEEKILIKMEGLNKIPQYKIYEQLKYGYIKVFQEIQEKPETQFLLKISGIWENATHYGLTYKFVPIHSG
jgi:uncharacterized CHY-type Zn-finger protein